MQVSKQHLPAYRIIAGVETTPAHPSPQPSKQRLLTIVAWAVGTTAQALSPGRRNNGQDHEPLYTPYTTEQTPYNWQSQPSSVGCSKTYTGRPGPYTWPARPSLLGGGPKGPSCSPGPAGPWLRCRSRGRSNRRFPVYLLPLSEGGGHTLAAFTHTVRGRTRSSARRRTASCRGCPPPPLRPSPNPITRKYVGYLWLPLEGATGSVPDPSASCSAAEAACALPPFGRQGYQSDVSGHPPVRPSSAGPRLRGFVSVRDLGSVPTKAIGAVGGTSTLDLGIQGHPRDVDYKEGGVMKLQSAARAASRPNLGIRPNTYCSKHWIRT